MHAFASEVASEKRRKGAGRVNHRLITRWEWVRARAVGISTVIIYVLYVLYVLASDQRKTADLLLKLRWASSQSPTKLHRSV
jgi:hypothetical protein